MSSAKKKSGGKKKKLKAEKISGRTDKMINCRFWGDTRRVLTFVTNYYSKCHLLSHLNNIVMTQYGIYIGYNYGTN